MTTMDNATPAAFPGIPHAHTCPSWCVLEESDHLAAHEADGWGQCLHRGLELIGPGLEWAPDRPAWSVGIRGATLFDGTITEPARIVIEVHTELSADAALAFAAHVREAATALA
jgi:hypothetical protein